MLQSGSNQNFQVGQVWKYKARQNESESTLTIVKVDTIQEQQVIHIYLEGLKIKNPHAPSGYTDIMQHAPCSEKSLKNSYQVKVNAYLNLSCSFTKGPYFIRIKVQNPYRFIANDCRWDFAP